MEHLAGKKKRKLPNCPNALFVHWLTEWKKDAADKGLKSQYTYGKMLQALKKYPLPLTSGKECLMLENFGAKTCEMLDKKLQEYIEMYGTTEPIPGVIDVELIRNSSRPRPKKPKTVSAPATTHMHHSAARNTPGKNKPYMPTYRSGPYAMLLTLYTKLQDGTSHMSKRDLMIEAQSLADASFTVPEPGSRYTAWSSMGTLIKKGYVVKDGNPARYSLTPQGVLLAQQVANHSYEGDSDTMPGCDLENTGGMANSRPIAYDVQPRCHMGGVARTSVVQPIHQVSTVHELSDSEDDCDMPRCHMDGVARTSVVQPTHQVSTVHELSDSGDDCDTSLPLAARLGVISPTYNRQQSSPQMMPMPVPANEFQFSYISPSGDTVQTKDAAAVTVDDIISVGFLIKCDYDDLMGSGKRFLLMPGRSIDNKVTAYIHNDDAPERCPVMSSAASSQSKPHVPHLSVIDPSSAAVPLSAKSVINPPAKPAKPTQPVPLTTQTGSTKARPTSKSHKKETVQHISKSMPFPSTTFTSRPLEMVAGNGGGGICRTASVMSAASEDSLGSLSQASVTSNLSDLPQPDFQFLPGSFQIILCIDNHEQYARSKFNKQMLTKELDKHGIQYDVRLLQVGDFLWIARHKGSAGGKDGDRELVLDYIIERKRIDDMAASIMDGRFKEQKFRLRSCGLSMPMLLVEECSGAYYSIPRKSLMQAATNTQVIDKFRLVKTLDLKDSFQFLITMTQFLQRQYSNKTLIAHSKASLQNANVVNDPHHQEQRLMTFSQFNKSSAKIKPLSIKEAFARQLICIHGITAEKIAAILEVYPTPTHVRQAYAACTTELERETLLSSLKTKSNKKIVTPAVSKHIYMLMAGILPST